MSAPEDGPAPARAPLLAPPLLLLRHGETLWNREQRLQGRRDSALTERGRRQAAAQGRILASIAGAAAYHAVSSPLGRARDTARIALQPLGLTATEDALLQEVGAGDWEGLRFAQVCRAADATALSDAALMQLFLTAPNGEGFDALQRRCRHFLQRLRRPTIAVSHSVTLSVLRGLLQGLSRQDMMLLDRSQGVVYAIENGVETRLTEQTPHGI